MEGQGGREKVVGYSSFPQMGLYSGPRSQAVQVPQCAFISQQLDSQGLPRILCCPSEACPGSRPALCQQPSSGAVGGGLGSTNKSLKTEVRLFHNLPMLDAVQAGRGKLAYFEGLQKSKFSVHCRPGTSCHLQAN